MILINSSLFMPFGGTVYKIVGLASQFATQNCLGCYSKVNLGS